MPSRSSPNEWSGSAPVADRTSRNTVAASSNETPCLARFSAEKAGDLGRAHLDGMALAVEQDVSADPRDVRLFGAAAVVARPHGCAHAVEELGRWCPGGEGLANDECSHAPFRPRARQ